jgi:hypothetical protein
MGWPSCALTAGRTGLWACEWDAVGWPSWALWVGRHRPALLSPLSGTPWAGLPGCFEWDAEGRPSWVLWVGRPGPAILGALSRTPRAGLPERLGGGREPWVELPKSFEWDAGGRLYWALWLKLGGRASWVFFSGTPWAGLPKTLCDWNQKWKKTALL